MFERRDKLVAHIQALIDEHGEGAVLFHSERGWVQGARWLPILPAATRS